MSRVKPITPQMLANFILDAPEIQYAKRLLVNGAASVLQGCKNLPSIRNVKVMKSIWLLSHFACALGFFINLWMNTPFWYYLSLGGALSTYLVASARTVVSLTQGTFVVRDEIPLASILNSESTLLLIIALLHVTSHPHISKLFSFALYSYINVISYVLQEAIPANAFTTALFPILSCIEPVVLGTACFADYYVQFTYYHEYWYAKTSLLYGLIFSYASFKRLERSDLARVSLYSLFDIINAILIKARAPEAIIKSFQNYRRAVHFLVPIQSLEQMNDITRKSSVKTRATSIFFEPISVINDLY